MSGFLRPTRSLLKKSSSSTQWLQRQGSDPYVKARGSYRSRAAFKLLQLDERHRVLDPSRVSSVVDLGAAPGGWTQVVANRLLGSHINSTAEDQLALAAEEEERRLYGDASPAPPIPIPYGLKRGVRSQHERDEDAAWDSIISSSAKSWSESDTSTPGAPTSLEPRPDEDSPDALLSSDDAQTSLASQIASQASTKGTAQIFALDILPMPPVAGVHTLRADFLAPTTSQLLGELLPNGRTDVVLSDMAASATGNRARDVESSLDIAIAVWEFCKRHLASSAERGVGNGRGGALVMKYFRHPYLDDFRIQNLKPRFQQVHVVKPSASRGDSSEAYWVCLGFKYKR